MGNELSVIIPTIQKKPMVLEKLVGLLDKDESVTEILIINNRAESPLEFESGKVKIYSPLVNLYVNRSWNLGISMIKNKNFLLLNDDMLPCYDFCSLIVNSSVFYLPDTGLIGISPASINQFYYVNDIDIPERKEKDGPVFSQMDKYMNTGDWGIAIFGKKHCWHNIPEDLKIICGDNYILKKQKQKNRINYEISNVPINHIHASSSGSPEFTKIIQSDIIHSARYFPKFFILFLPCTNIYLQKRSSRFRQSCNTYACCSRRAAYEVVCSYLSGCKNRILWSILCRAYCLGSCFNCSRSRILLHN